MILVNELVGQIKKVATVCLLLTSILFTTRAQDLKDHVLIADHQGVTELTYKVIKGDTLNMRVKFPPDFKKARKYPAIVFYFGGGWNGGTIDQFQPQAEYFASRGMITVLVDYRVKSRHQTTPYESVADAKSAIRFLRSNAKQLNIDTKRIVASGGSAGGHLAAACGVLPGLDEAGEDLSISSKANALVLFNPVFDNGPEGFEHARMGDRWREISPAHNITKLAPPTIIFLGREDHLIPVSIAENYNEKMHDAGARCELYLYDNAGHGFFNNYKYEGVFYEETLRETDLFLVSLNYIEAKNKL
ncbi:alpha/beta hydrolase [Reichenbachiella agarivorans]|uniref:Alpha/beta hydrolase n=1 Tax=Reichenbachiella agarivorans TaxID=2979464 RepID=A0ABY6CQ01_9BACT|nr:alpha/beta hydrolase [Reichenbachiella agarivorans]UXP32606.1 alpha/beta hydrolase [Reichenbachiella agarivorans]